MSEVRSPESEVLLPSSVFMLQTIKKYFEISVKSTGFSVVFNPNPAPSNLVLIKFFDMLARKLIVEITQESN